MQKKGSTEARDGLRLNKYIADTGYCSRRKADELIFAGRVTINGHLIIEPGYRVQDRDVVNVEGTKLREVHKCYILLNKTKDVISTVADERGRKTVMDLIKGATKDRVYPVGRLDRNTTGILLLTNDGELANRLSHPSGEMRKVYKARLDRPLAFADLKKIRNGVMLEDGFAKPDEAAYDKNGDESCVVLTLHIGWNRIVRRIFETLGYKVKMLDRVSYGGLTLHGVPRGDWRYLTPEEVKKLYGTK
ncbi:MAG: pseudouridine synthase [Bacteroidia bacterium]